MFENKMMTIGNIELYNIHLRHRTEGNRSLLHIFGLSALLSGSMGAITWAIRGSAGWGGVDGTVVPGLMWGLLWYYQCYRIGIDARSIVFWLGMGIALGGELGYGQYTSWILGKFNVGEEIIPIKPWIGYLWLFICGIGWAAPGGILLGWTLGRKMSGGQWILRILLMLVLLVFLFAWPVVDWLASQVVDYLPGLLFPNAGEGIYSGVLDHHLQRTVYTNTQNFAVLLWWGAALILAWLQNDRSTLVTGLLLGCGFGIGFMQSATWCLGYGFAPDFIDWWKLWELNAGFNLGLIYTLVLFLAIHQVDKTHTEPGFKQIDSEKQKDPNQKILWRNLLFFASAGSILIFFMGFEYFFWTGIFLTVLFFIVVSLTAIKSSSAPQVAERRKNILLVYSFFLLFFLLFHGGSERAGILLGLYSSDAVDQYAWPLERILIFIPIAIVLITCFIKSSWSILHDSWASPDGAKWSDRMVDLMTLTGFIGALSIWPEKIGVFYALFLMLALFAFNRLNRIFRTIEKNLPEGYG
jgi:hypothetical protein